MEVELDAFSGRPNPVWTVTADEAAALRALLATSGAPVPAPAEGLGYRGFVLRDGVGAAAATWRVHAGTLSRGGPHQADTLGAEAWLIRYARAQGFGAVFVNLPQR